MRAPPITSTITCPRCKAPVEGDFKYCPECAFRLRPGPPDRSKPASPPSRRGTWLLLAAGASLLAAGIFVGQRVHTDAQVVFQPPKRRQIRIHDIQNQMSHIPPDIAEWAGRSVYEIPPEHEIPDRFLEAVAAAAPDTFADTVFRDALADPDLLQNPLPLTQWQRALSLLYSHSQEVVLQLETHVPVMTSNFDMMRYEVTRGQWGEFLESVQGAPSQIANKQFVQDLWQPPKEKLSYARGAWQWWWSHVREAHRARNEGLPVAERAPLPKRPAWLATDVTSLRPEHAVLMLIPPEWARVSADGASVTWSIEKGTDDLPVTGVSWWDVKIFATWASSYLKIPGLDLPNWAEWQRAFHGGHAYHPPDDFDERGDEGYTWPWGDQRDTARCNNLDFRPIDEPPALRAVWRTYPAGNRGFTQEGILNMPGNAAEWTSNYELDAPEEDEAAESAAPDRFEARTTEYTIRDGEKIIRLENVACGGSYLSSLELCQAGSGETLDKRDRRNTVGFRLILRRTSGFGR